VEDEKALRETWAYYLEQEGYEIYSCVDGIEALEKAFKNEYD
jgi:DNA-binding response OmpR family regulator